MRTPKHVKFPKFQILSWMFLLPYQLPLFLIIKTGNWTHKREIQFDEQEAYPEKLSWNVFVCPTRWR